MDVALDGVAASAAPRAPPTTARRASRRAVVPHPSTQSLDFETIRNLELLANARTGSPTDSVFGIINHTKTAVGAQFLRSQVRGGVRDANRAAGNSSSSVRSHTRAHDTHTHRCRWRAAPPLRSPPAQLLSPVNDAATLNTRLDSVTELLSDESSYVLLQASLAKLPDLDSLLSTVSAGVR